MMNFNFQKQSPEVFCKKGVFKIFANFTGKHKCFGSLFNKLAGLHAFRPATLLNRDSIPGGFLRNL